MKFFMCCAFALSLFAFPATAQTFKDGQTYVGTGVYCDTVAVIVQSIMGEGIPMQETLTAVNTEAGSNACAVARLLWKYDSFHSTFVVAGVKYGIHRVVVFGAPDGTMFQPILQYVYMKYDKGEES